LRPTVIARNVRFGSQSDEGAKTREVLMSVLCTLCEQVARPQQRLKEVLDELARDPTQDALKLLWPDTS
jgi:hypothetical protein